MNAAKKSDEELMLMYQNGNADAFGVLFERYRNPIYAFLVRQCGNRESAADLTQDVFSRLIRSAKSFQHQSKFSTWIYTIARNAAVDEARKAKHRKHPSLDEPGRDDRPALCEKMASGGPEPDRSATGNKLKEAIVEAIERLPEDQREVFVLREYHGMPFHEISDVVGAKVGTVKSRMRYALEALRRELAEYESYARSLS